MKFYISGPMTGYPAFNFPAFAKAATELRRQGWDVLSAHEIPHDETGEVGSLSWTTYLRDDLKGLLDCDGLILLRGWPQSSGARLELSTALALSMPVHYYNEQLGEVLCMNKPNESEKQSVAS